MTIRNSVNYSNTICLFFVFLFGSFFCASQPRQMFYHGAQVSIGLGSYNVKSNFEAINKMKVTLQGVRAGFVAGPRNLMVTGDAGYFYSSASVPYTCTHADAELGVNFYFVQKYGLAIFVSSGIGYERNKLYGYYGLNDKQSMNFSKTEMPEIGTLSYVRYTVGTGLEYRLVGQLNFISLFVDGKYRPAILKKYATSSLANTTIENQFMLSAGIRAGIFR
jgi:hypothetical protein